MREKSRDSSSPKPWRSTQAMSAPDTKVPTIYYLRFSIYVIDPAEDSSYRDRFLYISYLISSYYYCGTKVVKTPIL